MSAFRNPYDPSIQLSRCGCGHHATQQEHDAAVADPVTSSSDREVLGGRVVESAVMRALFPQDEMRRRFLHVVGAATALSAISTLFPLGVAKEVFAQSGKPEKSSVKIGFIPITCATPIIMSRDFTVLKAVRPTPHREHELGDELFRPIAAIAARLGQATRHPCRIKLQVLQHPFHHRHCAPSRDFLVRKT